MNTSLIKVTVTCIVLLLSSIAAPALAGSSERSGEVGFDVGRTSDISDKAATAIGVRGGYHFNKWFQLEGQFSSASADEEGADATLSTLFVNGVVNFRPRPTIRPYVLAGVGQANLEFDLGPANVDDTAAAYQVGAGSRFFFGKNSRIAARVEASRLRERTFDDSSNYTNVSTGLTWRLGRRS